jgi:hypothetical protein
MNIKKAAFKLFDANFKQLMDGFLDELGPSPTANQIVREIASRYYVDHQDQFENIENCIDQFMNYFVLWARRENTDSSLSIW